ncbi:MAG TPA: hypothetical protein VMU16_13595 [Candidatus Binataceae bacterium]|nr:hypothetical protein [Candidatus Binataceae bacterium]
MAVISGLAYVILVANIGEVSKEDPATGTVYISFTGTDIVIQLAALFPIALALTFFAGRKPWLIAPLVLAGVAAGTVIGPFLFSVLRPHHCNPSSFSNTVSCWLSTPSVLLYALAFSWILPAPSVLTGSALGWLMNRMRRREHPPLDGSA